MKIIQLITSSEILNINGGSSCICMKYAPEIMQVPEIVFNSLTFKECKIWCCEIRGANSYTYFTADNQLVGSDKCLAKQSTASQETSLTTEREWISV